MAQCRVQWQACEHGNIPSHSIKGVECLECWSNYSTSFRSNPPHAVNKIIQAVNSSVQFQLLLNFQKFSTRIFSSEIKHHWRWRAVWIGNWAFVTDKLYRLHLFKFNVHQQVFWQLPIRPEYTLSHFQRNSRFFWILLQAPDVLYHIHYHQSTINPFMC